MLLWEEVPYGTIFAPSKVSRSQDAAQPITFLLASRGCNPTPCSLSPSERMFMNKQISEREFLLQCEFKLLAIANTLRKRGLPVLAEQIRDAANRIAEAAGD